MRKQGFMMGLAVMLACTGCGRLQAMLGIEEEAAEVTMEQLIEANASETLLEQYENVNITTVYEPGTEKQLQENIWLSSNENGLVVIQEFVGYGTQYVQDGEIYYKGEPDVEDDGMYMFVIGDYNTYVKNAYNYIMVVPTEDEDIVSQDKLDDGMMELVTEVDIADLPQDVKESYGVGEGTLVTTYIADAETLVVQSCISEFVTGEDQYIFSDIMVEYDVESQPESLWEELKETREQSLDNREITCVVNPGTSEEKTIGCVIPSNWYIRSDITSEYACFKDPEGTEPYELNAGEDTTVYVMKATDTNVITQNTENVDAFKPGVWVLEGGSNLCYFFDADGKSGSLYNFDTETGTAFTYEVTGNEAIFYMGAVDNPVPATIEVTDEEHFSIYWDEGELAELVWVSDQSMDGYLYGEDFSEEEIIGFKPGVWLSYGAGEYRYFYFNADKRTGGIMNQQTGEDFSFEYEFSDSMIVVADPGWVNPAPGYIEMIDEEHFNLQWDEGIQEQLTFLTPSIDDFFFYTDKELSEFAILYYVKTTGDPNAAEGMSVAVATNEDGSVSIQIYQNVGDHNSTAVWYTVDRLTASGTDGAGNPVVLTDIYE